MKKAKTTIKTMTLEQVKKRKLTKAEKDDLKRLAAMRDEKIDTSDIPEVTDFSGWKRGALYRPVTRPVTIRMNAPDLAVAQELSKLNGLPYQTYIKQLLHDALVRERAAATKRR